MHFHSDKMQMQLLNSFICQEEQSKRIIWSLQNEMMRFTLFE